MVQISNERQDRLCTFREVWNAALSSRRERQAPCVCVWGVCVVCVCGVCVCTVRVVVNHMVKGLESHV